MADVAQMDIVIGANVQQAIAGLEHLSQELADLSKGGVTSIEQLNRAMATLRDAAAKATDIGQLAKFNKALEALSGEAVKLKNVGLGEGLKKIKPGADQATTSLINLGRVVQDAPYGFIGIANNIDPLLQSFQSLRKETGSAGLALKALGGSLLGGGGIGVAVSVVTSLLVVFGDKLFKTSKQADEAAKAIDSINESAAKNILQFQELNAIATDTNQKMDVRLGAVQKLKSEYPNYLKNLSDEQILTGQLGTAYENINNALIAKATLQAAEEEIMPLLKQIVELRIKEKENIKFLSQISGISDEELRKNKETWKVLVDRKNAAQDLTTASTELAKVQDLVNEKMDLLKSILKETAPLDQVFKPEKAKERVDYLKEELDLSRKIYDSRKDALIVLGSYDIRLKEIQDFIKQNVNLKEIQGLAPPPPIKIPIGIDIDTMNYFQLKGKIEAFAAIHHIKLPVNFEAMNAAEQKKFFEDMQKTVDKQAELLLKGVQALSGAFEDIFTQLAETGKVSIESLLQSIEKLVIKMTAAALAAAAMAAILSLIPGFQIGTGVNAIKGFKGLFQHFLPFQHGGIVTAPTAALIGEKGPEAVIPLDRLPEFTQSGGQVIVLDTRISGNDLYLVQSRTQQRRNRTY